MGGKYTETITIKITKEMLEDLKLIAERDDRPVSSMVRIILTKHINILKSKGEFSDLQPPQK